MNIIMCLWLPAKNSHRVGTIIASRDNRGEQGYENNWAQSYLSTVCLVWAQTCLGTNVVEPALVSVPPDEVFELAVLANPSHSNLGNVPNLVALHYFGYL